MYVGERANYIYNCRERILEVRTAIHKVELNCISTCIVLSYLQRGWKRHNQAPRSTKVSITYSVCGKAINAAKVSQIGTRCIFMRSLALLNLTIYQESQITLTSICFYNSHALGNLQFQN